MLKYLIPLLVVVFVYADAKECNVNTNKKNLVKFISDAPIEAFEGTTDNIDGYINIESFDNIDGSELYFEVDLRTLDTGIGLRNRHMRENYLHTEDHPYTHFKGKIIKSEMETKDRAKVTVKGTMHIHGVDKEKTVEGYITTNHEGSYRINTQFSVALSDYNIEIPQLMFMKIDENMDLVLDYYVMEVSK